MISNMPQAFGSLVNKEYPGRLIIIGQDTSGEKAIIVYAITGRSPSSQARRMVAQKGGIWVKPTDTQTLKEGDPELLIYPAVLFGQGIAVSNGKQTPDILECLPHFQDPVDVLKSSLSCWDYEPDDPAFTPRISGCVLSTMRTALSIIRRAEDGFSHRDYFKIDLIPGKGKLISTYAGQNIDPLPPFAGKPEDVLFTQNTAEETARDVYNTLEPRGRVKDFRVSVACIFCHPDSPSLHEKVIINRSERNANDKD
jgi:IMP cyclohydrolase